MEDPESPILNRHLLLADPRAGSASSDSHAAGGRSLEEGNISTATDSNTTDGKRETNSTGNDTKSTGTNSEQKVLNALTSAGTGEKSLLPLMNPDTDKETQLAIQNAIQTAATSTSSELMTQELLSLSRLPALRAANQLTYREFRNEAPVIHSTEDRDFYKEVYQTASRMGINCRLKPTVGWFSRSLIVRDVVAV
jgi:hypothetical protein